MKTVVAGMDIGGTNTAIGLVDGDAHCLRQSVVPTAQFERVEDFVDAVHLQIDKMLDPSVSLGGIGIGAPNGNYYHGTIEHAPNLKWKGVIPLAEMFRRFYDVPVALTNDANAAAIGEMLFGAAKGLRHFIVITLGTGVGSGIVVNGEILYGHDGFAGEIGHTIVDPEGRECNCGRRGCLETYASATGICRTARELLERDDRPSKLRRLESSKLTAMAIALAAEHGDAVAREAFEYTGKILGLKLADAIAHTSPEAIILFGGLAQSGRLIFEPTRRWMDYYTLNIFKNKVRLLPSGLPSDITAILGSAALIWNEIKPSVGTPA